MLGSLRKLRGEGGDGMCVRGEAGDEIMFISLNSIFHSAFDH
jgi:hypothetical protein